MPRPSSTCSPLDRFGRRFTVVDTHLLPPPCWSKRFYTKKGENIIRRRICSRNASCCKRTGEMGQGKIHGSCEVIKLWLLNSISLVFWTSEITLIGTELRLPEHAWSMVYKLQHAKHKKPSPPPAGKLWSMCPNIAEIQTSRWKTISLSLSLASFAACTHGLWRRLASSRHVRYGQDDDRVDETKARLAEVRKPTILDVGYFFTVFFLFLFLRVGEDGYFYHAPTHEKEIHGNSAPDPPEPLDTLLRSIQSMFS